MIPWSPFMKRILPCKSSIFNIDAILYYCGYFTHCDYSHNLQHILNPLGVSVVVYVFNIAANQSSLTITYMSRRCYLKHPLSESFTRHNSSVDQLSINLALGCQDGFVHFEKMYIVVCDGYGRGMGRIGAYSEVMESIFCLEECIKHFVFFEHFDALIDRKTPNYIESTRFFWISGTYVRAGTIQCIFVLIIFPIFTLCSTSKICILVQFSFFALKGNNETLIANKRVSYDQPNTHFYPFHFFVLKVNNETLSASKRVNYDYPNTPTA